MADEIVAPNPRTLWSELPPLSQAKAWEKELPGSAKIVFEEVQRTARHKRRIAIAEVAARILLIVCAFSSVVLFAWLATYFVNHNAPTQGAVVVGAGLASLVGAFLGKETISRKTAQASADGEVNILKDEAVNEP